jgi:ribonuclease HI
MYNQCFFFTTEATAILKAIQHISKLEDQNHLIRSDSLSTLTSLQNCFNLSDISLKTINAINTQHKSIVLLWITGHSNIQGNETADKASKKIANSNSKKKIKILTYTDIKNHIKNICLRE